VIRSRLWFVVLAALALARPLPARAELLTNPDAESGNLAGWTDALGNGFSVWLTGSPPAYAGLFSFWGGSNGAAGARSNELRQDVNVSSQATGIDAGQILGVFSGHGRSSLNAGINSNARMVVEFRNTGGTVLATFDSGVLAPPGVWLLASDSRTLPAGTRTVRVRLLATRSGGTSTDAYFDALSFILEQPVGARHTSWGRIQSLFR
jgi:hypothetical protein